MVITDAAIVIGDFHKSWSRYFVSMSYISFVVSLSWCQGHVTAYFGFPTMPGMNDVMCLFVMCKLLIYPHLVGWMSQFWYIPTWLGDGCMYESLVIGRSFMMYRVMFFLKNIFLQTLLTVRESMNNTLQQ